MSDDTIKKVNPIKFTCEQVEALASEYLDGDLSQSDRIILERHIKKCEGCSELISDIQNIISLAQTLAESPIPEGVKYRLRKILQEKLGVQLDRPCLNINSVK